MQTKQSSAKKSLQLSCEKLRKDLPADKRTLATTIIKRVAQVLSVVGIIAGLAQYAKNNTFFFASWKRQGQEQVKKVEVLAQRARSRV